MEKTVLVDKTKTGELCGEKRFCEPKAVSLFFCWQILFFSIVSSFLFTSAFFSAWCFPSSSAGIPSCPRPTTVSNVLTTSRFCCTNCPPHRLADATASTTSSSSNAHSANVVVACSSLGGETPHGKVSLMKTRFDRRWLRCQKNCVTGKLLHFPEFKNLENSMFCLPYFISPTQTMHSLYLKNSSFFYTPDTSCTFWCIVVVTLWRR